MRKIRRNFIHSYYQILEVSQNISTLFPLQREEKQRKNGYLKKNEKIKKYLRLFYILEHIIYFCMQKLFSVTLFGVSGYLVEVEVDVITGM